MALSPEFLAMLRAGLGAPQATPPINPGSPPRLPQRPGFGQRLMEGMFPIAPEIASGMSPEEQQRLRGQAVMQLGLGMMAANNRGAGLGEAAFMGFNNAQRGLGEYTDRLYRHKVLNEERDYERSRDALGDQRYGEQREWRRQRAQTEDQRETARDAALAAYRSGVVRNQAADNASLARTRNLHSQIELGRFQTQRANEEELRQLLAKPNKTQEDMLRIRILSGGTVPNEAFGLGALLQQRAVTPQMLLDDPDL
jgi:hypothetical protein